MFCSKSERESNMSNPVEVQSSASRKSGAGNHMTLKVVKSKNDTDVTLFRIFCFSFPVTGYIL